MKEMSFCLILFFAVISLFLPRAVTIAEALTTGECGLSNVNLINNTNKVTEIDEFPWMGRLAYSNVRQHAGTIFLCQAVLITQRYMITVAHCLGALDNLEPYAVLLGDWDTSNEWTDKDCEQISGKCSIPMMIDMEEIVIHPYFDWDKHINDIGLLRLSKIVTYTDFIRPICLSGKDVKDMKFDFKQLLLTGFMRRAAGFKQKMFVPIFNRDDCGRIYKEQDRFNLTDSHVCVIACDNGVSFLSSSALMDVRHKELPPKVYLVGVISYRTLTCVPGVPDVFTRVDPYIDWIQKNIVP